MAEEQIFFLSNNIEIEGLLQLIPGERGVVITHPHSLYGGSMHNNVVESLVRVYHQQGYTTLRFNFRGVGSSQGKYDHGQGEQEDVRSALDYLLDKGNRIIDLAGYSFGAWVNALASPERDTVQKMIMVAPPVAFMDFGSVKLIPQLKLVIAGSRDQIAPPDLIETMLTNWNPTARLEIIHGADHFYAGFTNKLESLLGSHLEAEQD